MINLLVMIKVVIFFFFDLVRLYFYDLQGLFFSVKFSGSCHLKKSKFILLFNNLHFRNFVLLFSYFMIVFFLFEFCLWNSWKHTNVNLKISLYIYFIKKVNVKYSENYWFQMYRNASYLWVKFYFFLKSKLLFNLFSFLGGASASICHFFQPTVHLYIRHAPYFWNRTSCDHYFWYTCVKWWYLQAFFHFF